VTMNPNGEVSPLEGDEQFPLNYPGATNCFTTSAAIKAYAGGGGTITLTADTAIAAGANPRPPSLLLLNTVICSIMVSRR
jgi:hypothetical protein